MADAIARVMRIASRSRASIAFFAHPEFGKSFCIRALEGEIFAKFPNAGILNLEFGDDDLAPSEGRMLETVMLAAGCTGGMAKSVAGKRDQIHRALLALSGTERHIFLLIDEAQEMKNQHFRWLKRIINHLAKADVDVTTVLFGQTELQATKKELVTNGRSDLSVRFMNHLVRYRGVVSAEDIAVIMKSIDSCRWTVEGHEVLYTEFLFPQAYSAGFRFEQLSEQLWKAVDRLPANQLKKGIPMAVVGSFLSLLCSELKDRDVAGMEVDPELIASTFMSAYRDV